MPRARRRFALLAAAPALLLALAACAPGAAWGPRMAAAEKPCIDGAEGMETAFSDAEAGKITLNELKAKADAEVMACTVAQNAWATMTDMPPAVRAACMPVAEGRLLLARDMRVQLDHPQVIQDPLGHEQRLAALQRDAAACNAAAGG